MGIKGVSYFQVKPHRLDHVEHYGILWLAISHDIQKFNLAISSSLFPYKKEGLHPVVCFWYPFLWLFHWIVSCILWTSLGMKQIKSWRRYEFGLPPSPNPLETCATSLASTTMIINSNNDNGSKIGNRHNHSNKNNKMVSDNDNNTGKHLKLSKALSKHCK